MISTFTCLLLALITAHFPANVCGDGEEDLEEGNLHFGHWGRKRALHIANSLTLPFYLLPFYLLGRTEQSNHFSTFLTVNLSLGDALTKSGEIYYFERTLEI